MKYYKNLVPNQVFILVPQEIRCLLHEWQIARPSQIQLAKVFDVYYDTINGWENKRIQPLPLALRQTKMLIAKLSQLSSAILRDGNKQLSTQYFS